MLQRLQIALAQVNVLNKICQIIYCLCRAKEISEKAYNNTQISINL